MHITDFDICRIVNAVVTLRNVGSGPSEMRTNTLAVLRPH